MKLIVKYSTLNKVEKITDNLVKVISSLTGVTSEEVKKPKVLKSSYQFGKAFRVSNDINSSTIEINPRLVEDVLDAAENYTSTVCTVLIPAAKVYSDRICRIKRKYGLK